MEKFTVKLAAELQDSNPTPFVKEKGFIKEIAVTIPSLAQRGDNRIPAPVRARFYKTATRVYCVLWINGNESPAHDKQNVYSGAYESGTGFHKASAALAKCFEKMGITINDISGRGDFAMEDSLVAIAKKLFPNRETFIHVTTP